MSDLQRVREILAKAGGANDNRTAKQAENGQNVTYNFHGPVTVNIFSSPAQRAETRSPPKTRSQSPLSGQALRSAAQNRALLLTVPPLNG